MHAEQKRDTVACFDTEKVEKIFYNLLSNAIKYTPEGDIDITVESDGKSSTNMRGRYGTRYFARKTETTV